MFLYHANFLSDANDYQKNRSNKILDYLIITSLIMYWDLALKRYELNNVWLFIVFTWIRKVTLYGNIQSIY